MTTRSRGIDASSCQGTVDHAALAAGGFHYVIHKMTQGAKGRDSYFSARMKAARAAGLRAPFGYHFLTKESSIADQMANAIAVAKGEGLRAIALDAEYPPPPFVDPFTSKVICARLRDAGERCAAEGLVVVAYTYDDWEERLDHTDPNLLAFVKLAMLWMAWYPHEKREPTDDEQPKTPPPWAEWGFWQWSGNGGTTAPGIPTVVDHDVFNGTPLELDAWMAGTPTSETVSGS